MADFTPYFTLAIGLVSGWFIRLMLVKRSESREDINEVRREYLRLTECDPISDIAAFRLNALQKTGALRLGKREFEQLLEDVSKYKKEVTINPLIARVFTIRACLEVAHEHDLDLSDPTALHHWMMDELYRMKQSPVPTLKEEQ